jgi:RNA polymerase sigma-70 factor (ECF subfamily)
LHKNTKNIGKLNKKQITESYSKFCFSKKNDFFCGKMDYKSHIEGLQRGTYNDFKVLYEAFAGKLYGFVVALTKSNAMAKDIVQETFLRIWVNRKNIDPGLSFKSYLFKIAQNLVVDGFRKQMSNPMFEDYLDYRDKLAMSGENVEQKIDFDLFMKRLEIVKRKLSIRQREIFEMNKEQGISVAEIAERLALSEQTVYNQLSMALQLLRKKIGNSFLFLFLILFNYQCFS